VATARWINVVDDGQRQGGWSARLDWQATDRLRVHGGLSQAPETSAGTTVETASWQAGLAFDLTDRIAVRLDYAHEDRRDVWIRHVLATARREPAPFLLVLKNCRSGQLDWEPRLRVALAKTSMPLFRPGPDAAPGAEERALRASGAMFGLFVDSMITWLEDLDGLTDEERIRWWGRIVKAWREAAREAFRLD
jgi:hypothetical protein